MRYNYYVVSGMYFSEYSIDLLQEAISRSKGNQIEFRFSNIDSYNIALKKLFTNDEWVQLKIGNQITHNEDDDLLVIKICY